MNNLKVAALASVILLNNNVALASNAEDRYIYIGTELGISEPVVKEFSYKSQAGETKMRLKQSRMYGGRIGYSFYPNMAVEISGTHQPKYRLAYRLPAVDLTESIQGMAIQAHVGQGMTQAAATAAVQAQIPSAGIPTTPDITKVSANVFMLNWIYELEKQKFGLKPYVIFGAGIAQVNIRPQRTYWQPDASLAVFPGFGGPIEFFRVKKNIHNCFAYQFGGGISKDISDHFAVDLGAKLQVVKDIKIKYEKLDIATQSFKSEKPIKKTIGVGEFTLGFTFKIPVK
ncbi:MAG: porin family protein [Rickettsiaceae bacterium]|nr:porin family protein [Rickettsiaceae bacterium]